MPGWVELRFAFNRQVIDTIKQIPGLTWSKERRVWLAPLDALPALESALRGIATLRQGGPIRRGVPVPLRPDFCSGLRPYQVDAANRLVQSAHYLLTFEQRVGKTRPAAAAGASLLASGAAKTIVLAVPSGVTDVWAAQFKEQTGLDPVVMDGLKPWAPGAFEYLTKLPALALIMPYELIAAGTRGGPNARAAEVKALLKMRGGKFAIIADEVHFLKNRKAGRTKFMHELARDPACGWRWGLTGTPQRNYPRDNWGMFEFVQPGSMGSYSKFGARYAGGHMGDYGWVDDGTTNPDELKARLAAASFRLTRREVAAWLPQSERVVIPCSLDKTTTAAYAKAERAFGTQALAALRESGDQSALNAMRELAKLTVKGKLSTMLERLDEHLANGHKVIVAAHFHESLKAAVDAYAQAGNGITPRAHFVAGGWVPAEKRRDTIQKWREHEGPAALFVNMLSSGVGIDLSDADVMLSIELTWVPADFLQFEARIQDVHLGKRTTAPVYEYLLAKGTIDEDMGRALIDKIGSVEKVVGHDSESKSVDETLRSSGLVARDLLSLSSEDPETVAAALDRMRDRLLSSEDDPEVSDTSDNNDHTADGDDDHDEPEPEDA